MRGIGDREWSWKASGGGSLRVRGIVPRRGAAGVAAPTGAAATLLGLQHAPQVLGVVKLLVMAGGEEAGRGPGKERILAAGALHPPPPGTPPALLAGGWQHPKGERERQRAAEEHQHQYKGLQEGVAVRASRSPRRGGRAAQENQVCRRSSGDDQGAAVTGGQVL